MSEVYSGTGTNKVYTSQSNGEYTYRVQACNASGCSLSSFGKRIEVVVPPGLVTGLSASPTTSTDGAYTLSWNAVATATSYVLSESVDAGGNPVHLPAVTTTSQAFTGKANGTYRYYVKACAYETCGGWNATPVYVTVNQANAPATPTGLHGPPPPLEGPVDFEIAWNAVAGATSYRIEEIRSCNPNPVVHVSTSPDHLVGWGNCSPAGTGQTLTFNYRVKACNASEQCSPYSPQIQLTFTVENGDVDRPQPVTTTFYLHTDALGSIVAETNEDRHEVKRNSYEPYGGPSIENSFTDGPGYTGHVTDANTGLIYMQQRYYDAIAGRFLSNDPVAAIDNGGGFNRYAYANNNPYRFTDPDGRKANTCSRAGATSCPGSYSGAPAPTNPRGPTDRQKGMVSIASDGHGSAEAAAHQFGTDLKPAADASKSEPQSGIVKTGPKTYAYTVPMWGGVGETIVSVAEYFEALIAVYGNNGVSGFAHIHFDTNLNFSFDDVTNMKNNTIFMHNRIGQTRKLNSALLLRAVISSSYRNKKEYIRAYQGAPGECVGGPCP